MLTNSPDCSTCLFSWYGLLITVGGVGGVGGDFSQTRLPVISLHEITSLFQQTTSRADCSFFLHGQLCSLTLEATQFPGWPRPVGSRNFRPQELSSPGTKVPAFVRWVTQWVTHFFLPSLFHVHKTLAHLFTVSYLLYL